MKTMLSGLKWGLVVISCPYHLPIIAGVLAGTAAGRRP